MKSILYSAIMIGLLQFGLSAPSMGGSVHGSVVGVGDDSLQGVSVSIEGLGTSDLTDKNGEFQLEEIPDGTHVLVFQSEGRKAYSKPFVVAGEEVTRLHQIIDWKEAFSDTITVTSVSRYLERLGEAPAAVAVISGRKVENQSGNVALPKLLEFTTAAEVTQNGLYDFNFNARGLNTSLNRRVLTLIDGRNFSVISSGSQDWSAVAPPLHDVASVEFVRGPISALYGADAFNGVINVITKDPREQVGGRVNLASGNFNTRELAVSISRDLSRGWFGKMSLLYRESDDYARSRVDFNQNGFLDVPEEGEYEGLFPEAIPLQNDRNEFFNSMLRLDRYLEGGRMITLEAGSANGDNGGASVVGPGRFQYTEYERPYLRVKLSSRDWFVQAFQNRREASGFNLIVGLPFVQDSQRSQLEAQGSWELSNGKGRLLGGGSHTEESVDSFDPQSGQTIFGERREESFSGLFGQIEYALNDDLKSVVSARWDDSSMHERQLSFRAAAVWNVGSDHIFRLHYSKGFQKPNYGDLFGRIQAGPGLTALAFLEDLYCEPYAVECGLSSVPNLFLGNRSLKVEEINSWELGYNGLLTSRISLQASVYHNLVDNFITDFIPSINPTLGRINPHFPAYRVPAGVPDEAAQDLDAALRSALGPNYALLTNDSESGAAIFNLFSTTNFGRAVLQGAEIGLDVDFDSRWSLSSSVSTFEFDVEEQLAEDPITPNAPGLQFKLELGFTTARFGISAKYRYVESFDWARALYRGRVPSYDLVDIFLRYEFSDRLAVDLSANNAFARRHFQVFGGDLIQRRIMASISIRW